LVGKDKRVSKVKEVGTLELQINKDYRVRTDELNIFLEKKRIAEKGKSAGQEVWEPIGSYPEFDWAYRAAIKHGISTNDLKELLTIVTLLEKMYQDIKESLSEANLKRLDKQMRSLAMENELLKKKLNKEGAAE
jgi:hypothetical protein